MIRSGECEREFDGFFLVCWREGCKVWWMMGWAGKGRGISVLWREFRTRNALDPYC